jgi:hypothetical protein
MKLWKWNLPLAVTLEEDAAEKGKSPVDDVCSVCFATPLYEGGRRGMDVLRPLL